MQLSSSPVLAVVQWLAVNALPIFLLTMALLLLLVAGLWQGGRRFGVYREGGRFSASGYQVIYMLIGFSVIVGSAALFAELAENLGDGRQLGQLDQLFSKTIGASVGISTSRTFAALTHLGDPMTLIALALAVTAWLVWQRQFAWCAGWTMATAGNALLNPLLKIIFARARPVHDQAVVAASGFSFPSGHSSGSVVVYGMLAYGAVRLLPQRHAAWRLPAVLAATATAFTVSSSRVFLQVHFPSDVLAGIASGAAWLAVCVGAMEVLRYQRRPVH